MLHIRNSENGATLGVLADVNFNDRLEDLRARIDTEIKLDKDYSFLVLGTGLKSKQERKYLISHCITKLAGGEDVCSLKLCSQSPAACTPSSRQEVWNRDTSTSGTDRQQNPKMPKLYFEEEIRAATGTLEKEKMVYFNRKTNEMSNNPLFDDWNRTEIQGVINVSWTLKKTELLKNCVKELVCDSVPRDDSPCDKSLMKNLDGLEKAQFMTNHHYRKFCEEITERGEGAREELESEFDKTFTGLKTAQSVLTKSIETYKSKVFAAKMTSPQACTTFGEEHLGGENPELTDEEMVTIFSSVKDECE